MTDTTDKLPADEHEAGDDKDAVKPDDVKEGAEKEPMLKLTVAGPCKNPEGDYVGLSKKQRDALGVVEGGTVEIFKGHKSIGIFTVGKGSSEVIKTVGLITANGIPAANLVTIRKAKESGESLIKYGVRHEVEDVPEGLEEKDAQEYQDRTARRMAIIEKRFPGVAVDEFITVPTAVLNLMTGGAKKVASISVQKVRFGGSETEITVIPTGTDIGLTSKAAKKLNIPAEITEIGIRVKDGVLIID
jgi:hypothetical protein